MFFWAPALKSPPENGIPEKSLDTRNWRRSDVFIINFEKISQIVYCCPLTSKYRLGTRWMFIIHCQNWLIEEVSVNIWCFLQFGVICTINKTWKTPMT